MRGALKANDGIAHARTQRQAQATSIPQGQSWSLAKTAVVKHVQIMLHNPQPIAKINALHVKHAVRFENMKWNTIKTFRISLLLIAEDFHKTITKAWRKMLENITI